MAAIALAALSGWRWLYTIVWFTEAWPKKRETTGIGTPFITHLDAAYASDNAMSDRLFQPPRPLAQTSTSLHIIPLPRYWCRGAHPPSCRPPAGCTLRPVYLGDALFSCLPLAKAVLATGADFLFVCKKDGHNSSSRSS